MKCDRAREFLSLYAGGDLPDTEVAAVSVHLQRCRNCRDFYEALAKNQQLFRSLRREPVAPATLTSMRRNLLSRLETADARLSWGIRLERLFILGMRRPRFALATVALAIVISVTLLAQLRHVNANSGDIATLENGILLRLPDGYTDWTLVGDLTAAEGHRGNGPSQKVYMNPVAYREYKRSGRFPEGTVMVLESRQPGNPSRVSIEASLKDRRFDDGWGYFVFDGDAGRKTAKTGALANSLGCVACHRDRAATDHVFTQFYPNLKAALGVSLGRPLRKEHAI